MSHSYHRIVNNGENDTILPKRSGTVGNPGMKRPFVEAFTDAYRVKDDSEINLTAHNGDDSYNYRTSEAGDLSNPFNSAYQEFENRDPALDWVRATSYSLVSGVISTALGGFRIVLGAFQDYLNSEDEPSSKKRKLNSDQEEEDLIEPYNQGFVPSGPLPEQHFLDQAAYSASPQSVHNNHNSHGPIMFSTANNIVHSGGEEQQQQQQQPDSQLLDQLHADEQAKQLRQRQQHIQLMDNLPNDTPTRPNNANSNPINDKNTQSNDGDGKFTPMLWNRNGSNPVTQKSNTSLLTPMFHKKNPVMFSPETTPTFNPHSSNPYSAYGTKFNFKQSRPISDVSQQDSLIVRKSSNNNKSGSETPNTLANRLRNAVLGTYQPPKTVVKNNNEMSYDLANSVERQVISPPTIFRHRNTRITSQSGGFLKQLQDKRVQLELAKEAEFREKSKKWNEEELPSSELAFEERARVYSQIIERHKAVEKEVRKLRIGEKEDVRRDKPVSALPPADSKKIENYWKTRNTGQVLTSGFKIDITVRDLQSLKDREWLNDNVIDFYLSLVTQRSEGKDFAFSTHFYTTLEGPRGYSGVERWAKKKKIDVTKLDRLFVPINRQNTHWCLAVVNNKDRRFEFYDSMGGNGRPALELVREYMVLESERLYPGKKSHYEQLYDTYEVLDKISGPRQENGYDCGVFTLKTAEVLARDKTLNFSQKDMPVLRRRMAYEIISQHLEKQE